MQPRTLTMKNFGPFIHETVDFGAFAGSGLFLISGKTGAGKTTIFDGMTYALFGQTSGKLRAPKEMRSAFAPATEETAVSFTFEHGGFLYQVERRPEQEVAKKRGSGMTKRGAKTTLTIFDETGQEQRQITKDVDNYITELLHLTAEQFFKIIMLPQGEFRNFLVASSRDKEQVLQKMFDTQLYGRLNEWLKEQVAAGGETLKRLEIKGQTIAEHFQWHLLTAKQDYPSLPELLTAWQGDLAQLVASEKKQADTVKQAKQLEKQAESAFYQGKEVQGRFDELAQVEQKATELAAQAEEMAGVSEAVAGLTWAKEHRHLPEELQKEEAQLQQLLQRLASTQLDLDTVTEKITAWQAEAAKMADTKEQLAAQQQQLTANQMRLPLAQKAATQEQTVAATQSAWATLQQQFHELTEQKADGQQKLAATQKILDQGALWQEQKLQLQQLATLMTNWRSAEAKLAESRRRLADKEKQQTETATKLATTKEKVATCHEELLDLKSRQASVMIAKLALDLRAGTPCPVCGSLDHPGTHQGAVAFSETEIQENEARLQELETAWQQGEQQRAALQTTLAQLATRQKELQEEVTENQQTVDHATAAAQKLVTQVWQKVWQLAEQPAPEVNQPEDQVQCLSQQVATAEAQLEKAHETQTQLQAQLTSLEEKLHQINEAMRETENRLQQQSGQLQELQGQLGQTRLSELEATIGQLQAAIQQLTSELTAYETSGQQLKETQITLTTKYQEIANQKEEATARISRTTTALQQLLAEAPFATGLDSDGLQELVQQLPKLPELTARLQQYQQQQDYVSRSRKKLQEQLAQVAVPDLVTLELDFNQATEASEKAQQQLNVLANQRNNNQDCVKELKKLIAENEKQLAQQGELVQLADTVGGRNAYKTSLERYILQSYLQEILVVANQRLLSLTRGRYQFQLADKETGGRGMKGLDIDIYDDNAGMTRRVQTLSGGESFIAALALALSLADVIQNRSGGIAIEALFIDEGFGSLDEESLEMAMEALSMIETEGRLIGIISHVAELKTTIPRQVLVHADGAGQSTIKMQLAFQQ